jgi:hypothetical protein
MTGQREPEDPAGIDGSEPSLRTQLICVQIQFPFVRGGLLERRRIHPLRHAPRVGAPTDVESRSHFERPATGLGSDQGWQTPTPAIKQFPAGIRVFPCSRQSARRNRVRRWHRVHWPILLFARSDRSKIFLTSAPSSVFETSSAWATAWIEGQ